MTIEQVRSWVGKAVTSKRDSYNVTVISRSTAAIFGGYILAATLCSFIAAALPLPLVDATLIATMLSFGFYAAAAIRAFSVASSLQAWLELLGLSLVISLLTQLF
ncbi:hypothetical protein [Shewanella sp. UCD-KL12]|uniref:hypothetical protein n=1 Tax=Shewanella sp. UCD-KL12 TaxID=1917163 RepID=UPI002116413D|nr:hypothetical protein [Shewanella sp. UCD-KL12]